MHSTMVPIETPAADFNLPGTDGNFYSLDTFKDRPVLVVVFMCNHCPYVKAVLQRLIDLANHFREAGVQFIGINSNNVEKYPDDSPDNMRLLVQEHKIPFPYLFDESQKTARDYDAVCTPDIYVYGPDRKLAYRGRIDDNWQHPEEVQEQSLKLALEAIVKGEPVPGEQVPSMGCSIKWK